MRVSIWYYLGVIAFSIGLGLLIGSSNSPVAGVAITSLFGLVLSFYTIFQKKEKDRTEGRIPHDLFAFIGKSLLVFTLGMIPGVYWGSAYRLSTPTTKENIPFIWPAGKPPKSLNETLDWIMVTEILTQRGYTRTQIEDIYKIRQVEVDDTSEFSYRSIYRTESPYYKTLLALPPEIKEPNRGPASIPPGK